MKKTLLLVPMAFLFALVFGQPATGTDQRFNEVLKQPYAMIVLPYSPQVIIAAMKNYQSETQSNRAQEANPRKYESFGETPLIRTNIHNADLVFEIGLKAFNNKNESVVYLLLNSPTEENNDSRRQVYFDLEQAKAYLDNLAIAIQEYASNQQIKLQTFELGKADRKLLDLVNYGSKLESRKADLLKSPSGNLKRDIDSNELLDRQIAENKSAQEIQTLEIARQREDLKVLIAHEKINPDNV